MKTGELLSGLLCTSAMLLGLASPAAAQQQPAEGRQQADTAENSPPAGEEILVTARRREENVQTVPVAITVVSQAALDENNVTTIGSLQYLVPSLSVAGTLNRDTVNVAIRGQGSNGTSGLPGVIAYLNDVPIPTDLDGNLAGGPGLFFDLTNVQVLKGPQGTLFGRNSVGGALLLESARPTNELGGSVQLGYGNYDNREVEARLNLPLVADRVLARIAFNGARRDGFTRLLGDPNHPDGVDVDDRDYWSVRGSVTIRPTDGIRNDTVLTYSEYDSHGSPGFLTAVSPDGLALLGGFPITVVFPTLPALLAQQNALGARVHIPVDTPIESRGSTFIISNNTRIELSDNLAFRNIFGYAHTVTTIAFDQDYTGLPFLNFPVIPRRTPITQFTDEVQLLGSAFGGRLNWIAGGFYLIQPYQDQYILQSTTVFGGRSDSESRVRTRSTALFAQGTFDLSSLLQGLQLTAGLRQTWDSRGRFSRGAMPGNPAPPICTEPRTNCSFVVREEAKDDALTWTIGLDYRPVPGTLLYATSRRGYRAGGLNGADASGIPLPTFNPEFVTDYEFGIKSDWHLGAMPIRTNASIYYQNYTDIQIQQILATNGGAFNIITANGAAARLWGIELEVTLNITRNLQIGGSFDYLDFKYTDLGNAADPAQLLAGSTLNRPPVKYGLSGRYTLPLPDSVGRIALQANWNWQDDSGDFNLPVGGLTPSFGLLNASLTWDGIGGTPLDATLYVSNLTNELYVVGGTGAYTLFGTNGTRYGEPRMYGIRLRYSFGASPR